MSISNAIRKKASRSNEPVLISQTICKPDLGLRTASVDTKSLEANILSEVMSQLRDFSNDEKEDTSPPVLTRQKAYCEPEAPQVKHFLFVSDVSLSLAIKNQMKSFRGITSYSQGFLNRSCTDLSKQIEHIWINLRNKQAKQWLELNLKKCDPYVSVLVWSSNKRSKFLDDVHDFCRVETKLSDINKIHALSLDELVEGLDSRVDIHDVPSTLCGLLGCGSKIKPKKKA